DRASDFESAGRRFESCRARFKEKLFFVVLGFMEKEELRPPYEKACPFRPGFATEERKSGCQAVGSVGLGPGNFL
ncbi:MAG: hypothetical protein ACUVS3_16300, partial [Thermodesulfobacteriota bacterium]